MRFEVAHLLQPVGVVTRLPHQLRGDIIFESFPPQAEKQHPVLDPGIKLVDLCLKILRSLVLGIFRIPQTPESADAAHQSANIIQFLHEPHEILNRDLRSEHWTHALEFGHLCLDLGEGGFHLLAIVGGKKVSETPARKLIGHIFIVHRFSKSNIF